LHRAKHHNVGLAYCPDAGWQTVELAPENVPAHIHQHLFAIVVRSNWRVLEWKSNLLAKQIAAAIVVPFDFWP
jgi:hypothetical protein